MYTHRAACAHRYHHHGHDPANARSCPDPIDAAVHGSLSRLKEAIECEGADIDEQDKGGNTALMIASMAGHNPMVKLLLEHGADTERRNQGGHTALMRAAARGRFKTCRLLIKMGNADVEAKDNHGDSVIMHAHLGHHEMTERHLREHIDRRRRARAAENADQEKTGAGGDEL